MIVYGLISHGYLAELDGAHSISSKKLFRSYEDATKHIEGFKKAVTTRRTDIPVDWGYMNSDGLKIRVAEYEIDDLEGLYEEKYRKIVEACRVTKSGCFCGCHITEVIDA